MEDQIANHIIQRCQYSPQNVIHGLQVLDSHEMALDLMSQYLAWMVSHSRRITLNLKLHKRLMIIIFFLLFLFILFLLFFFFLPFHIPHSFFPFIIGSSTFSFLFSFFLLFAFSFAPGCPLTQVLIFSFTYSFFVKAFDPSIYLIG